MKKFIKNVFFFLLLISVTESVVATYSIPTFMDQLSSEEEIDDSTEDQFVAISLNPVQVPEIESKIARLFSSIHFTFQSVIESLDRPPRT